VALQQLLVEPPLAKIAMSCRKASSRIARTRLACAADLLEPGRDQEAAACRQLADEELEQRGSPSCPRRGKPATC
jgi:hypothetical protein